MKWKRTTKENVEASTEALKMLVEMIEPIVLGKLAPPE
jgi:hypothetical protein